MTGEQVGFEQGLRWSRAAEDISRERMRAHIKHGERSIEGTEWDDHGWLPILVEEVGEVARVFCALNSGKTTPVAMKGILRSELVQVAAMATAWIDSIDYIFEDGIGYQ